jgi:hypothetical protein
MPAGASHFQAAGRNSTNSRTLNQEPHPEQRPKQGTSPRQTHSEPERRE